MFVFKLHTFDKRLLKVEAASFFFLSASEALTKSGRCYRSVPPFIILFEFDCRNAAEVGNFCVNIPTMG